MRTLEYKERKTHGTFDFPVEAYCVNEQHPRYVMPLHWHEEYEIIQVKSGEFQYEIGQEKGTAKSGDILFINSGEFHSGLPSKCEYNCILFDFNLLINENITATNKILATLLSGDISVSLKLPKEDQEISSIINCLLETLIKKPIGFELKAQGLLYQLFGNIIEKRYYHKNTGDTGSKKRIMPLKNVLSLIEKEYSSPLTLEQLARSADMSPKYFCHFFKQMTKYSPIEYLNRHRIEVACFKLISGTQNITEICYECGFNDLSYFIRVFKKNVGVTPKKYALMHKKIN